MKTILKSKGQMGIFYTQKIRPTESRFLLQPSGTELAQNLKEHKLIFQVFNFFENECRHWRKNYYTIKKLKSKFKIEENLDIYKLGMEEAKRMQEFVKSRRIARYLYHVRKNAAS